MQLNEKIPDGELLHTLRDERTRREFLHAVSAGTAGVSGGFLHRVQQMLSAAGKGGELEKTIAANRLPETFGLRLDPHENLSMYSSNFGHPDNAATRDSLQATLPRASGKLDTAVQQITGSPESLEVFRGQMVLIGGPNSTVETRMLFGYEGVDGRNLERTANSIPLKFSGVSSITVVERDAPRDGKPPYLARMFRPGEDPEKNPLKPVKQPNWGVLKDTGEVLWLDGRRGSDGQYETMEVLDKDQMLRLPTVAQDYAIIHKVPNLLDPDFAKASARDIREWPTALVIEGMTGMGTTSATNLMQGAEQEELRLQIQKLTKELPLFQVLLSLKDIRLTEGGFHQAHNVSLKDVAPLSRDRGMYLHHHHKLQNILKQPTA